MNTGNVEWQWDGRGGSYLKKSELSDESRGTLNVSLNGSFGSSGN